MLLTMTPISRRKNPKNVAAAKKAWVTIRLNKRLREIRLRIIALKAWETRLINEANRK